MDLHKPKPWHNWREFLKELGTIALGVSIALGAEQTVEWFHWREQVALTRESLAAELSGNIRYGMERVWQEQCLEERLDRIADILDTAAQTGILPAVADIGDAPYRPWPHSAWDSLVNSQVASHFPRQMIQQLGSTYEQIKLESENNQTENIAWADLSVLVGPGGKMTPSTETALRLALSRARDMVRNLALDGGQLARRAMQLDLPYTPDQRKSISGGTPRGKGCPALRTAIPQHYGEAPAKAAMSRNMAIFQKDPLFVGLTK